MADIKFHCPDCNQRIAVDDSAANIPIACPACNIGLIIPGKSGDPVMRTGPAPGKASASPEAEEALKKRQAELEAALKESAKLKAGLEAAIAENEALRAKDSSAKVTGLERERDEAMERAKNVEQELGAIAASLKNAPGGMAGPPSTKVGRIVSERDDMRAELSKLKALVSAANTERDNFQAALLEAKTELKTLRDEKEGTRKTVEGGKAEIVAMRMERDAAKKHADVAVAELVEFKRTHETDGKKGADLEVQVKDLMANLAAMEKEKIELAMRISQNPEAKELAVVKEKLGTLQAQLSDATGSAQTFRGERDRVRGQLGEREEALKAATASLDETKAALESLRKTADESKGELAKARDEAAKAGERLDEAQAQLEGVRKNAGEANVETEKLRGELSGAREEAKNVSAQFGESQAHLAEARKLADEAKAAVEKLGAELSAARGELAGALKERDELRGRAGEMEAAIAKAASVEAEAAPLKAQVTELQNMLAATEKTRDELGEKLLALEIHVKERAATVDATQAESRRLTEEVGKSAEAGRAAHARVDALEKELGALKAEAAQGGETLEKLRGEAESGRQERAKLGNQLAEEIARRQDALRRVESVEAELAHRTGELGGARHDLMKALEREKKLTEERNGASVPAAPGLGGDDRLAKVETELAAAEETARMVTKERDRLKQELERASADLQSGSEAVRNARISQETGKVTAREAERQLEDMMEKLNSMEKQRDDAKSEVDGHKEGLLRAKQHIAVLQSRRDQMRDEIARLKVKLGLAPDAVV